KSTLLFKSYTKVIATSIKVINFEFDDMPVLGINSVIVVRDREPPSFWVEARHNINNKYLSNKTNAINQNSHSTTAILIGKHVIILEDISLITSNHNDSSAQSITLPWLSQSSIPGYARANRQPQGAAPKTPKKGCNTLSNMNPT
ncbi:25222_t:CDS:2, partial [Cetraspora pellucida]